MKCKIKTTNLLVLVVGIRLLEKTMERLTTFAKFAFGRTTQFNLTTPTMKAAQIRFLLDKDKRILKTLELAKET
jgi:hypothetical protein